ncbi:MAG: TetR/AcrR family transcriptional regulator [Hyphomonas sp.]|nr:TetR/AcrR family transcriptional regulator [Hyphomonas sp.]
MARFSRDDWLALGARLLAEEGPEALTLERLTDAAGRTRGSFYHHFAGREAFLTALMDWWRAQVIDALASRLEGQSDPAAIRALLRDLPMEWDTRFELGVRRLAAREPVVEAALRELDEARIQGLAGILSVLRPDVEDAYSMAFIQYAATVGGQWILPSADDPRIPALRRLGNRLFGLDEPEPSA